MAAIKLGQFTADETRKGQFLRENRRNSAKENYEKNLFSRKCSGCALCLQRL